MKKQWKAIDTSSTNILTELLNVKIDGELLNEINNFKLYTAIDITSSRYLQSSKNKFNKLVQMYLGISDHGNGGKIIIGSKCAIAAYSKIINWNHNYKSLQYDEFKKENIIQDIRIGNNCWLGYGSTIISGGNLEDGCIVMPNSVVNKSIEKSKVFGGIPVKFIKDSKALENKKGRQ